MFKSITLAMMIFCCSFSSALSQDTALELLLAEVNSLTAKTRILEQEVAKLSNESANLEVALRQQSLKNLTLKATTLRSQDNIPLDDTKFTTVSNSQILVISGTFYSSGVNASASVNVFVNGNHVDTIRVFQNGGARHMAFPTKLIPLSLPAGSSHLVRLSLGNNAVANANDRLEITLIELQAQ